MSDRIKNVDVVSQGLVVALRDGREALLKDEDLIDCAEKTGAFERIDEFQLDEEDEPSS